MHDLDFAALIPSLKLRCPECDKIIAVSGKNRLKFELSSYTEIRCPYCEYEGSLEAFATKTVIGKLKESTLPFKEILIKGTTFRILGERDSKKYPIVAESADKIVFFNRDYLLVIFTEKQKILEGGINE